MTDENKKIIGTQIIRTALIVFGGLIIAMAIFWFGMFVGFTKAGFSYEWGGNYRNLFEVEGPGHHLPPEMGGRGFLDAHSAAGSVIKVDTSTLIIKGDDNVEKNIFIDKNTVIRRGQDTISPADIKADDRVIVLGVPSSTGQIEARLIRLMPKEE